MVISRCHHLNLMCADRPAYEGSLEALRILPIQIHLRVMRLAPLVNSHFRSIARPSTAAPFTGAVIISFDPSSSATCATTGTLAHMAQNPSTTPTNSSQLHRSIPPYRQEDSCMVTPNRSV